MGGRGEEGLVQGEGKVEGGVDHGAEDRAAAGFVDAEDAFCGRVGGEGWWEWGVVRVGFAREDRGGVD